ncbi:type I restriction enzyme R subunit [Fontibacillus solani]|uniref:type I site-specific deoxyribonuclease n=1 Tax=Fontibacillus solani TaxID=1572857 RepID=A0A7W3XR51_9BACL|nr:type I restriction endonuclease [Fontibacillus solani]MBA9085101.1 type I restriction enzyme R subunit [Fontibacillus solani]
MAFNENTRVKIPALLHLTRLGYEYVSLKHAVRDTETNIFPEIFAASVQRLNPGADVNQQALLSEMSDLLDYNDLGRAFYKRIITKSGLRLIDFEDFNNNSFHVCTELTCKNGEDEFRPDITILINGMPLVFIEVKKPNNRDGILAERNRINNRFQNNKFRRFIGATQFMIFSNNMEYDTDSTVPIQGAFYASVAAKEAIFNCFREEVPEIFDRLVPSDDATEDFILSDNNLPQIKYSEEYITNKSPYKPTNRILSSLLSRERLQTILHYGIVYTTEKNGLEKHVMRYPQLFATLAIARKLDEGVRKGIIWHTQGSGKTALSYFNVAYMLDYFQKRNTVPKFYFIVDRLDLMTQTRDEFENRGLRVNIANSKDEFVGHITAQGAIENPEGTPEITVVNIQKFSTESKVVKQSDYDINVQRVYFIDEVHRSYNPQGSFLANLYESDPNAIIIGLTGTPLLNQMLKDASGKQLRFNSKDVFGEYIHKYFYSRSIQDGYTLRLIREGIETTYKARLKEILEQLEVALGSVKKGEIYAHHRFVEPLAEYIINDFITSRVKLGDASIGGMVVCDTSEQAKELFRIIVEKYPDIKTSLILHDVDDKETRRNNRDEFKLGNIDLLIVYNMLLTGFDAKRLKKLYLNRVVKDHNLLQTLTRVNRPYKDFRYGFVVDFADISREFDKTNAAYFKEFEEEIGDEWQQYSTLFKTAEEIEAEIGQIQEKLFYYDIQNAERFSEQISDINDRTEILELKRALENAKVLGNLIRTYGHDELADKLDFKKLNNLLTEVNNRLALINQREALENAEDNSNILNMALEEIVFSFRKVSERELPLGLVEDYKEQVRKTREAMQQNFDHKDPVYVTLYEELERLFKKKKLTETPTPEELDNDIKILRSIFERISEQNRRDRMLADKYQGDQKFARVHKRLVELDYPDWSNSMIAINQALLGIKKKTDENLLHQAALIKHEAFFEKDLMRLVISNFGGLKLKTDATTTKQIGYLIANEYFEEYRSWAV